MPLVNVLKSNFSAGELAPQARALTDLERYRNGAKRLENWQVLTTGGVTRRFGTRYIATAAGVCVLRPFEPNMADAYVLEFSNLAMRVYKNTASLGVSVVTPYPTAALRYLRTAQSNDVMIIAHSGFAPRRLARTAPTTFVLSTIPFYPPPTFEGGAIGATTLTLSATTGAITATASATSFMPSDVQRQIKAGVGRAIITAWTSGTVVSATVIDAFQSTTLTTGTWFVTGSPIAQLTPSAKGPVGANVTVTLGQTQPAVAELINQDFTTWTEYSGTTIVASGTHLGAANSTNTLVDNANNFVTRNVLTTQVVMNTTDASRGVVSSVSPYAIGISGLLFGGTDNDFDTGDAYQILETGASIATATTLSLNGGTAGHGWRERPVSTTVGSVYEVTFTVEQSGVSAQVGSVAKASDLYPEAGFLPGEHSLRFTATTTTSYVQFRNNQNAWGTVRQPSTKVFTISGFRGSDVGRYIRVHGGLILLRTFTNEWTMTGEIIKELTTTDAAAANAWTLEDPSWSDESGWPRAVVLYEGRLYFAGTSRFPQTIWGSAVDNFFDFFAGELPDSGVEFSVVESGGNITLNIINWLMPTENLLAGTSYGVTRLIGSGDDPITAATPPRARSNTFGSDDVVMPLKVDQALIFPARQGSKLREVSLDQAVATRFQGRDLAVLAGHLLSASRLLELAYAAEPISTIFGVRSDGVVPALTYEISEKIAGWWRFVTQGQVESMAVIPHPTQNRHQIWLAVNRATGRFIEVIDAEATMTYPGGTWQGLTVDAGVTYNGAATNVIGGLAHLNGALVDIVADGAVLPQQTVSGGVVTLPVTASAVFIGLHFDALGETLPPDLPQGTIRKAEKRWAELMVMVDSTIGLTVQEQIVDFRTADQLMDHGLRPVSDDLLVDTYGWDRTATIRFAQTQPLPATVIGVIGTMDVEVEQG